MINRLHTKGIYIWLGMAALLTITTMIIYVYNIRSRDIEMHMRVNAIYVAGQASIDYWTNKGQWPKNINELLDKGYIVSIDAEGYVDASLKNCGPTRIKELSQITMHYPTTLTDLIEFNGAIYYASSHKKYIVVTYQWNDGWIYQAANDKIAYDIYHAIECAEAHP